ncbi:hypothetical protein [Mobilicoccus caccae]|uniref:Uncharacterized protein n=1 Tax=Mobilicoccus caccae TaxID=1859295 RepID=A0ABQ6IUE5_9MICO|nr:hypothetical protein [Mobilicoccus caccae]GMA41487.1 hypothetical protein GCM10025883_35320 [Mobilicoccus caccae]
MDTIHISLLAASAVLVAATAAGDAGLRRRGRDLPLIGYIIGGALVVGNAACLLPTAPRWYQVVMLSLSLAGFVWFFISVASATERSTEAQTASRDIYAGLMPTRPTPPRPALRVVQATVVDAPDRTIADTPTATQETFAAHSPAGSRATTGSTYVAADIGTYIDARGTRRTHGRHVARTHDRTDPTERFLRLADAYSIERGPRSLGRSSLA